MTEPREIIDFWFGAPGSDAYGVFRDVWFERDDAFDAAIRAGFLDAFEAAAAGTLTGWRDAPESCLALILLVDQFPRNLFRGTPRAFATDPCALDTARHALDAGYDRILPFFTRKFVYMPYMHSERLDDQRRSCALFEVLGEDASLRAALRHFEIIERFGRFPHRNAVLGRTSTPEERAFLLQPHSSF